MKRENDRWRKSAENLGFVVLLGLLLSASEGARAETLPPAEPPLPPENFEPPIEIREEPVLRYGYVFFSPETVRSVLENFLAELHGLIGSDGVDFKSDYEVAYGALLPFLASSQFNQVILESQYRKEPLELVSISPERLREGKMIQEFSERFYLPLDFEPNQRIVPSRVRLSLSVPWRGIPLEIASKGKEIVYLLDASKGSILKRYERSS